MVLPGFLIILSFLYPLNPFYYNSCLNHMALNATVDQRCCVKKEEKTLVISDTHQANLLL
jgi:hypothetical protein